MYNILCASCLVKPQETRSFPIPLPPHTFCAERDREREEQGRAERRKLFNGHFASFGVLFLTLRSVSAFWSAILISAHYLISPRRWKDIDASERVSTETKRRLWPKVRTAPTLVALSNLRAHHQQTTNSSAKRTHTRVYTYTQCNQSAKHTASSQPSIDSCVKAAEKLCSVTPGHKTNSSFSKPDHFKTSSF